MKKTIKQVVRTDLLSKSEFARKYKISRSKLDELIRDNMLNTELISGVAYINIADKGVLNNALETFGSRGPGRYPRIHDNKPYMPKSEEDAEFERAWRESMGIPY
jgi:hypothetical protein